jgi:hypothetical protein
MQTPFTPASSTKRAHEGDPTLVGRTSKSKKRKSIDSPSPCSDGLFPRRYPKSDHMFLDLETILLALVPKRGGEKHALPPDVWQRVQRDSSISVEQYRRKGGNIVISKTDTHLENTGVKRNGKNLLSPISSFIVKSFRDSVLTLSGYSLSQAKQSNKVCTAKSTKCLYTFTLRDSPLPVT